MSKPKRSIAHVVPEPGPGKRWCVYYYVSGAGTTPIVEVRETKTIAVSEAVAWAKEVQPSQVFIHGKDGRIQDERTYQDDPPETPGIGKKRR
jgi:hypothetical protein